MASIPPPSASKPPIRIAIIGFGGLIGRRHTAHVLANASATLAAVVDGAPGASDLASQLAPGVPYYPSVTALLSSTVAEKSTPEAAIVCTPNAYHVPVALELVEAGVHLLVEKPLADTKADARLLVDRARSAGVKLLVGHHRRFNPYVIAAKKALAPTDGETDRPEGTGTIKAVSGLWTTYKPDAYFAAGPWRLSRKQGGGPVMINLVHEVDVLQYLLGPIVRVSAEKMAGERGSAADLADSVEDGAALTLRFASGAVGTFMLSDAVVSPHFFEAGTGENPMLPRARYPCQHDSDEKGGHDRDTIRRQEEGSDVMPVDVYRIFGSHGTLSVPDMTLWTCGNSFRSWDEKLCVRRVWLDDDPRVPFDRQLDYFISVVRGEVEDGQGAGCTGEEGLRVIAVCEAVIEALDDAEGGRVKVDTT